MYILKKEQIYTIPNFKFKIDKANLFGVDFLGNRQVLRNSLF